MVGREMKASLDYNIFPAVNTKMTAEAMKVAVAGGPAVRVASTQPDSSRSNQQVDVFRWRLISLTISPSKTSPTPRVPYEAPLPLSLSVSLGKPRRSMVPLSLPKDVQGFL